VGSELTTGETRDTNGGELGRALSEAGVTVRGIAALPDDLELVTAAFRVALEEVDLVVTTGGLGPTPDDLTREAIAAAVGETVAIDPGLEAWLRNLFERRGMTFLDVNLKQAWLIPSATSIPNHNGTAPGWWVDRPDGRVVVLLPGPPREMRPMWSAWVERRLRKRGLGEGRIAKTLRTYGIGESTVAHLLGDEMLRRPNPMVATYARADWLDIRISAVEEEGRPAEAILADAEAVVRSTLEGFVWAEGETTWGELLDQAATAAGLRFATVEAGTHGALGTLLGEVPSLVSATLYGPAVPIATLEDRLDAAAAEAATGSSADVGVALAAEDTGKETRLRVAIAAPERGYARIHDLRLFQRGGHGRFRAAIAATAYLVEALRELG